MATFVPKLIGYSINFLSYIFPAYAAKLAVLLFSKPQNADLDDEAKLYLKESKQEDLSYKGFTIKTYNWSGSNKTILLVHGWDSNSFRWKDLIEHLKQDDYNIISIDGPAHLSLIHI